MYKITVFTPAYNRAHTLERLYRSLQQQTVKDFEWLVIDDGSTDETHSLLEKWILEKNDFPINYHYKENGGKHVAINYGLDKAQGKLFFTVDSDDFLTDNAIEKIISWADSLPKNEKFCGIAGNMGTDVKETPNTLFSGEWRDATLLERYPEVSHAPVDGERAFVFYTAVHKNYKYPVFENENFMTEAVVWNRMAHAGYKIRVYNEIIYIYKYLPHGLTLSGNRLFVANPRGYALWLREKALFCNYSLQKKIKIFYSYSVAESHRLKISEIANNLGINSLVVLGLLYFSKLRALIK